MVAGRCHGRRMTKNCSSIYICILLTLFTLCQCDELQLEDERHIHDHDVSSTLKHENVEKNDPSASRELDSSTNGHECPADGGCGPADIGDMSDTLPAEAAISKGHFDVDDMEKMPVEKSDDHGDAQGHESEKDEKFVNGNSMIPNSVNGTNLGNNSSIFQWIKFILDPIIEEFKDGIYPKLTESTNSSESDVSIANDSSSVNVETSNETIVEVGNSTQSESNSTETGKKVKFECTGRNVTDNINATVKLITTAKLLQLLNFDKNDTENVTDCLLVMFYAPWCHFCAKIAPHYNALARAFPQLDFVAVDTAQFSNLLARFGTVSVPNILVFHQSRAAVKFNQTVRTFDNFVTFVTNSTGLEPNKTVNVTEIDYLGPVPSVPTSEPDYLLLISWIFVIFCSSYMFIKSNKGQQWINRVRVLWVLWQEHQHID